MGVFRGMVLCSRKLRNQVRVLVDSKKGRSAALVYCLSCGYGSRLTVSLLRPLGQWQTSRRCHRFLRWGHAGPLIESSLVILCLGAGTEPTAALAQYNSAAGWLEFCQEWTSKPGSHNAGYVNQIGWVISPTS